jgi:hypothetical protein
MTQSSISSALAASSANISTPAPNSRSEMPGTSLEEQFLSLIEDALGRLGLEKGQVEVHVQETPVEQATTTLTPRQQLVITIAPPEVDSASSATRRAASGTAAEPEPARQATTPAETSFLSTFHPAYLAPTAKMYDETGGYLGVTSLNQHHFASQETATILAEKLGATVVGLDSESRNVSEYSLKFEGSESLLNAGLVARMFELAQERGEPEELVISRLRDEVAMGALPT